MRVFGNVGKSVELWKEWGFDRSGKLSKPVSKLCCGGRTVNRSRFSLFPYGMNSRMTF